MTEYTVDRVNACLMFAGMPIIKCEDRWAFLHPDRVSILSYRVSMLEEHYGVESIFAPKEKPLLGLRIRRIEELQKEIAER